LEDAVRQLLVSGAALLLLPPALADAAGYAGHGEVAAHGVGHSRAFATASPAGRSTFRNGGFASYGAPSNGDWGFDHSGGRAGGYGRDRRGRRPYRLYPYALGGYADGYGYPGYGYGGGLYGPQEPYGESSGEIGAPPWTPGYAPTLAPGAYGPASFRGPGSPYVGSVYTSGQGAYAYGYNGYAQTPALPYPACGC
jgi:hypothetical protein